MPRMPSIAVIAAYLFVDIDDTEVLRERLHSLAAAAAIKGTVIIAREGINAFLAGPQAALQSWLDALREDPRFSAIPVKWSRAASLPFRHLRVKCKREIIRMDQPTVHPGSQRASAVDATTLKRWLDAGHCDEGRPVLLLDTRNGFEVEHGAFDHAVEWHLNKFSDFPAALAAHRDELVGKTVVSYCTGGIRCEKATLWMRAQGIAHVHQLDGGILKYFEDLGSAGHAPHFDGKCFVFDERETLDASLQA